jgi:hypothetical protein
MQSPLNFLLNQILISDLFELCHSFKGSVSYLDVMILPCILVTSEQQVLKFSLSLLTDQPPY